MRLPRREVGGDQLRLDSVVAGQVVELDRRRHGRAPAGVDRRGAGEVHDHEQPLLRPDAQLARGLADVPLVRCPDLADDLRVGRVGDVEHEHPGVRVPLGPVGAVADVQVVVVDGRCGVHPPVQKGIVADDLEVLTLRGETVPAPVDPAHADPGPDVPGQDGEAQPTGWEEGTGDFDRLRHPSG